MAAGSGEVPVVPTEAAEEKKGEVSAAAVEKKGEGAVVSEAEKKGEGVVVSEVEKKGEGDMVSEVVEKVVSLSEAVEKVVSLSEAAKKEVSEALEKAVLDAAEKAVSEAAEKVVSEAAEKVVSEALDEVVWDAAEKVVSEALEKAVLDAAEKVVSKAAEKVVSEEVEKKGEESVEKEAGKREEEESGRMITLESNDGEQVEVTEASARLSELIGEMIDSGSADNVIPLLKVDSKTLNMVIEYCDKHAYFAANKKSGTDEEKGWDKAFIGELDKDKGALFAVIMAANFLNIQGLLDLTCQSVADTIKGKTPEEIREAFNIKDDLTEQEKEEIRKENDSAFE